MMNVLGYIKHIKAFAGRLIARIRASKIYKILAWVLLKIPFCWIYFPAKFMIKIIVWIFGLKPIQFNNFGSGLVLFFGNRGSGKSSVACAITSDFLKQKERYMQGKKVKDGNFRNMSEDAAVYSNFPIDGACPLDWEHYGDVDFQNGSVCIVDEAATVLNNRNFTTNFKGDSGMRKFEKMALSRHYRNTTLYFIQNPNDCDSKLLGLSPNLIRLKKCWWGFGRWVRQVRYDRRLVIVNATDEATGKKSTKGTIDFTIVKSPCFGPGNRGLIHISKYWHMYDSWSKPNLPKPEDITFDDLSKIQAERAKKALEDAAIQLLDEDVRRYEFREKTLMKWEKIFGEREDSKCEN
jgi:hypothetical protein